MADTSLACDGPLNGTYITPAEAEANNYEPTLWSTGELVYLHAESPITESDAFPEYKDDAWKTLREAAES